MKKKVCAIQEDCQICPYVNHDYSKSLDKKSKAELLLLKKEGLLEFARIQRTVPSPRKLGYRTVFKLAVRPNPDLASKKRFRLGLFQKGSHRIGEDLTACPLHSAPLRDVLKKLGSLLEESTLTPFDEIKNQGDIKYLIGRTNRVGDSVMLTWVISRPLKKELRAIGEKLIQLGVPLRVQAMNIQPEKSNAIWGDDTQVLTDEDCLTESIQNKVFQIGPLSFSQVNPWQADNIYKKIELLSKNLLVRKVAWDLFSGVGPIALTVGTHFERVVAIEENLEAVSFAQRSAKMNHLGNKFLFQSGLVEKELASLPDWAQHPDLIVVNPSRRGIHSDGRELILRALREKPHSALIYLSCAVESFSRDLKDFKKKGLVLKELQGFDMMAQTDQLEWLGLFTWQQD